MTTVQEIEAAVAQLPPEQLADFRVWLTAFVAQIETDYAAYPQPTEFMIQSEAERAAWQQFALQNLARAYGDDEPEYSVADLKKANPDYAGG